MTLVGDEITSQPACWRRSARLAAGSVLKLPYAGERVAALGCGTSWYVAQAYASRRAELHWALGVTDAFTPTELPIERPIDRTVVITRSGTTTEALRSIERMQREATFTTVITAVGDSPAAELAGHLITLGFADERSVVQTRFATSALALLRAHLGEDLSHAIADAERALAMPLPNEPSAFDHFVFLGAGWSVGIANEAALKLREAAQAHTESYPTMEYRHGPISLAGPSSLVWILGSPDPGVADDVRRTGATVRVGELDPMAELVLIQR